MTGGTQNQTNAVTVSVVRTMNFATVRNRKRDGPVWCESVCMFTSMLGAKQHAAKQRAMGVPVTQRNEHQCSLDDLNWP